MQRPLTTDDLQQECGEAEHGQPSDMVPMAYAQSLSVGTDGRPAVWPTHGVSTVAALMDISAGVGIGGFLEK